jgi:perosamine synthetase
MKQQIPLSLPSVGILEAIAVGRAVKSGWLTQFGNEVETMELNIRHFYSDSFNNSLEVTSTSNGTTALHLALLSMGISEGDEVIIPDFCYVAVPNSILYCSAVPVVVDIDPVSWNLDISKIAQAVTEKTKAIILVDNYGRGNDTKKVRELLPPSISIIQDSAETFPGKFTLNEKSGADLITLSCYANKVLTSGEGGAVLGNPKFIQHIRSLKNQSQNPQRKFSHIEVGYNYRLTNMQAAVFNVQWRKKRKLLEQRMNVFNMYFSELAKTKINWSSNFTQNSTPWLFTISIQDENLDMRNVIACLRDDGIESRPGFTPISDSNFLSARVKITEEMKTSLSLSKSLISLPTFPGLKLRDIKRIVGSLEKAIPKSV